MTLEQRLDYLGAIHKALKAPEVFRTHRAVLLAYGEAPVLDVMAERDGAFTALATASLTFGRTHLKEPFVDDAVAMLQNYPALLSAIQSRVPVVSGYDALEYRSQDQYIMVKVFERLYDAVVLAAQNGDPQSCELAAPVDLRNIQVLPRTIRFESKLNVDKLNVACAAAPIRSQAIYQHRVALKAVWSSAYHDTARISRHKQEWINKALVLENKCASLGINLGQIQYNKFSMDSVARDMQPKIDESFRDGMDEFEYREKAAERSYLWSEANLYFDGAIVSARLTPYLFVAAVGHSCG